MTLKEDLEKASAEAVKETDNNFVNCDACGKPIIEGQNNVGHECDLHDTCVNK